MICFLPSADRESLLGRVRSDFDGIDVDTAGNARLKAVLVFVVYDLLAWACAENDVVWLDFLYPVIRSPNVKVWSGLNIPS